jgi:ankyrin repeat protein
MHMPRLNKLCIPSFSLLISFFLQNCNLATNNLPSIISYRKHTQPSYLPTTNLSSQPEEEAIVIASPLPILPISKVFTASSGEQISFLEEAGIWQAKILASYLGLGRHKLLRVICEHQGDILTMLNRLAKQRPTIHKHRIHILPTPARSQCIFLGSVGLLGGMEPAAASDYATLPEAVKTEDLVLVESLLVSGANPNSLDQYGVAPLENATWQGCLELVNLLLKNGADPNQPTSLKSSYLHIAAMKNYVEMAKLLIENGANINATTTINNMPYTPLDLAMNLNYVAVVQLLLENGAKPTKTQDEEILHWAAEKGHLGILHLLLEREPAFNINIRDYHGFTLLTLAAKQGHVAVANLLLDKGADPDMATEDGFTPLHWATDNGHLELVNLLVEKGANVNATAEPDGFTPLHLAVDQNYIYVTKLLLEKGADPNITTENGAAPLHWAAYNGHLEQINLLLDKGAELNITDHEGWTPLHIATNQGYLEIMLSLLARQPALHMQTNHGKTFLHILVDSGIHNLQEVIQGIESAQQAAFNKLLAIMEDCCPELTNNDTKRILAMIVDYVAGLDVSLKNQENNTVLDILSKLDLDEEVLKTLKIHHKLGDWLKFPRQKREFAAISNGDASHRSALKKARYQ